MVADAADDSRHRDVRAHCARLRRYHDQPLHRLVSKPIHGAEHGTCIECRQFDHHDGVVEVTRGPFDAVRHRSRSRLIRRSDFVNHSKSRLPGVNIFEEYLEAGDFDPRWRPVLERLGERAHRPGAEGERISACAIWELEEEAGPAGQGNPILVWRGVYRPGGNGGVDLGGVLSGDSIACGTVSGHCLEDLDAADLTWASYRMAEGESLRVLADFFTDWLLEQMDRPVDDLLDRRVRRVASRGAQWTAQARQDSCRLTIERASGGARDRMRAYTILIDGSAAGTLKAGQSVTLAVLPGRHTVQMKIDWCTSRVLIVSVGPHAHTTLTCAPGGPAIMAILNLFRPGRYIKLEC
jgi:hypothetical protein